MLGFYNFFRAKNPSAPLSPEYVIDILALCGNARNSIALAPMIFPSLCLPQALPVLENSNKIGSPFTNTSILGLFLEKTA